MRLAAYLIAIPLAMIAGAIFVVGGFFFTIALGVMMAAAWVLE